MAYRDRDEEDEKAKAVDKKVDETTVVLRPVGGKNLEVVDPSQADDFIKAVDQKRLQDRSVDERVAYRADGRYYQLLSYRGTEKQKALIDFAAAKEKMSIQKLLETILMPALEERYGKEFSSQ